MERHNLGHKKQQEEPAVCTGMGRGVERHGLEERQGAETCTKLVGSLECYDEVRWERAKPGGRGPIRKPVRNGHLVQNSNANSELFDSQVLEYRPRRERKGKLLRGGGK